MNAERFKELLDAYGASPARWPEKERPSMEAFCRENDEARAWLADADRVDAMLATHAVETRDLSQRILAALPRPLPERFIEWLLPRSPALWWRPAVAAALPVALGVLIGAQSPGAAVDWVEQEKALFAVAAQEGWYE